MAKELPYFKFEPNQWENGNIQICSREDKGLFIDLCSMYWSRLGDVPLKLAIQKLCGGNASAFDSLCEENIITIIDGNICIDFLNEQLQEFEDVSKQNSKNAKEGWEKRRKQRDLSERNASALNSQSENDAIREEEIKVNNNIKKIQAFLKESKKDVSDSVINNNMLMLDLIKNKNEHSTYIESLYMRKRLKYGSLGKLLKEYNLNLGEQGVNHVKMQEYKKHFSNWLNTMERLGNLSTYQR